MSFPCPSCVSVSMLHAHVFSMSKLRFRVHAACPCPYYCKDPTTSCLYRSTSLLQGTVYAACPCPCCPDLNMQHVLGPAAWTWSHSICWDLQHGNGHAALTRHGQLLVSAAYPMAMSMQHVQVHSTCPCMCSMDLNMQH